jgi:hypothetical protein
VKVEIRAVAFGTDAETARQAGDRQRLPVHGLPGDVPGNGKHPVLHIQSFQQD